MPESRKSRGGRCFFCATAWAGITKSLGLSKREVEILQWQIMGKKECQVADLLGVSLSTVCTHQRRLRRKLGVHSQIELIVRLFDAYLDWLCRSSPPRGCRLKGRLTKIGSGGRRRVAAPATLR